MSVHTSELQALSQLLGGSYKEPGYEDYEVRAARSSVSV